MQTIRSLKRRISAVRGTAKIVNAMKMVSAARLKGVQKRMTGARYYAENVKRLALEIAWKSGEVAHPAFVLRKKQKNAAVIVVTAERGFCGSLCENMLKQLAHISSMMKDRNVNLKNWVVGARGFRAFKKYDVEFSALDFTIEDVVDYNKIRMFSQKMLKMYIDEDLDQVILAFNKFISTTNYQMTLDMFLPVWVRENEMPLFGEHVDFIYDPNKELVLEKALMETLNTTFASALLEGRCVELATRVVAMDKAHQSANDLAGSLERDYHRARQSGITRELMDIVGGAEALRA